MIAASRHAFLLATVLGVVGMTVAPAAAHHYSTRCDRDGDECYRVLCDDDGDSCTRVSSAHRSYRHHRQSYDNDRGYDRDENRGYDRDHSYGDGDRDDYRHGGGDDD